MTRRLTVYAIVATMIAATGCRRVSGSEADVLPGRTRPLLQHNWPHPRDLKFAAPAFQPADPKASLVVTPEGLRAYIVPAADEQVVQIAAVLPLGRALEQTDEIGAAELVARFLNQGIRDRLGPAFLGRVQLEQEVDLARVALQIPAADWRQALGAVIGAVQKIPVDATAIAAFRTGAGYTRQTRGLGGAGFRPAVELARMVGDYPLAPPDSGVTVRQDAVAGLASRTSRPDAIVLGIGGAISRADVEGELRSLSTGWHAAAPTGTQPPTAPASKTPSERFRLIDQPGYTTWMAIGHRMSRIKPADEAAVAVMGEILNIRLNIAVREIRGLANQAVLQVQATSRQEGLLHVRTGARAESVAPLIHYSLEELRRIRDASGSPTADELEQAKGGLVLSKWQGSLDGARDTSATYALETVRYGSLDRLMTWPDSVRAVTAADVQRVATTYVHPDQAVTVVIGPLDTVRKARHPRWPFAFDELMAKSQ
jgi:zinc protease